MDLNTHFDNKNVALADRGAGGGGYQVRAFPPSIKYLSFHLDLAVGKKIAK